MGKGKTSTSYWNVAMKWYSDKPVVVAWDFSDMSRAGLEAAGKFVDENKRIIVVHVTAPLRATEPAVLWGNLDETTMRKRVREKFEQCVANTKFERVDFALRLRDPAKEICKFADEIGAGLIMIPSQGKGWVARMVIGSVAERVLHLSHCPVLILHGLDRPWEIPTEADANEESEPQTI